MPVSIRTAVLEDLPAILAIERASVTAAHWSAEQYKSRIESGNDRGCLLVADCGGGVCGFLCIRVVAGEWEIENVVVESASRRRGVGQALLQSLIERWQQSVGAALLLEVRESNTAARAVYAKSGLKEVGRRRSYYQNPTEDAILYARHRE